jgi:peptide/nickel transport system permease protein
VRLILRRPHYLFGWIVLTLMVLAAVFAPFIATQDPTFQRLGQRLLPPELGSAHPLGTDQLGRDMFSRLVYGARVSIAIGLLATLAAALVGGVLGLFAGYLAGKIGALIMGVADAQLAFPFILLAIAFVATLGSSLLNVIIVLSLTNWVVFARTVFGMTLSLKQREFIEASRSVGATALRILFRHLPPHVLPTVVVLANLQVGRMILFESALSYLGMGVPAETPTWGAMLSDARRYMETAPWISILPGVAIVSVVLATSLVGDWVNEAISPRSRGRR